MATDTVSSTRKQNTNKLGSPRSADPVNRTQEARRAATISKLTDAAIEALVELGYAKASTNEICQRAAVSQGALFRHFDTRVDFMAHVAEEVFSRQVANFESRYLTDDALPNDPLERAIRFTRVVCHSPLAKAWLELVMASRTDRQLEERVSQVFKKGRLWARTAARNVFPPDAVYDIEKFNAVVDTVLWMFEMEGFYGHLDDDEASAESRLQFAIQCYRQFFKDQNITNNNAAN